MKSIKEKQILVKWAKAMNEPIDSALAEEVDRYNALQESVAASVKSNIFFDLADAARVEPPKVQAQNIAFPIPPSLDDLEKLLEETKNELVQAQPQEEPLQAEETLPSTPVTESLIDRASEFISKELKIEENSYQQPEAPPTAQNFKEVTRKLKFLEEWIAKVSSEGPGGGAGDIVNLDHPTRIITDDYSMSYRDYYVGVNATKPITITLPSVMGRHGRVVVIKDESGNCSNNPITVSGTVDNDTGGFILQVNNGGIQMIYRDGWRII